MTLVTTCPKCETSFRVVADQLKLRRGLVRCGNCRTVFSGLESLRRLEEDADVPDSASQAPPPATAPPGAAPESGPLPVFGAPAGNAEMPSFGQAERLADEAGPEDYAPWRPGDGHPDDGVTDRGPGDRDLADDWRDGDFDDDEASPMTLAVDSPETVPVDSPETVPVDSPDTLPVDSPETLLVDSPETLPVEYTEAPPDQADEAWRAQWQGVSPSNVFRTPPARRAAAPTGPVGPAEASPAGASPAATREPAEASPVAGAARAPERAPLHDDDQRFAEELEAVAQELEAWDDGESAIDYFSAERQRRGFIGRNGGWKLLGAAALVLLLGLQAVFANRDWLAARFPALEPMIATLGAPFGLEIALPGALDSLAIESFELQAAGRPGLFSVSAILRNDASHAVRWPSMLLTLTDPGNRVLLRKAIDPADYLPLATVESGLRPRSERPIRLALEADEVQPAGYSVTLFYR